MRLEDLILEQKLLEAPHVHFNKKGIPSGLSFLIGSFVDLGFENLGLDKVDYNEISKAFINRGLIIPGTTYQMRKNTNGFAFIEPISTATVKLPANWADAVMVIGADDEITYAGKLVRSEQVKV